jgi:glycosyltransferase involved in cell wall biosynthesis
MSGHKRLAFFMPSLDCGGVERVLLRLAGGFADRGCRVDVVVASVQGPSPDGSFAAFVPANVNVVDLGCSRVLFSLPGLVSYMKRERPDALLAAMDHINLLALWARRLAGVETRVVASVHSTASRDVGGNFLKRALIRRLLAGFLRRADAIIAVSKGAADDYSRVMGLTDGAVRVIYNPAIAPEIALKALEKPSHPWYEKKTSPMILSVGRLTPAKDFPNLIRAMPLVHAETGARLVILGEGAERGRLESQIRAAGLSEVVDLPGFADNPYSCMKRSDAFVVSSSWEGLPTVLIEAMSLGTPVVSTDCPSGPAEILEGGKWGRLVSVGDPGALAAALVDTLRRPQRDAAVGRAGDFSVDKIIREYADVLSVEL